PDYFRERGSVGQSRPGRILYPLNPGGSFLLYAFNGRIRRHAESHSDGAHADFGVDPGARWPVESRNVARDFRLRTPASFAFPFGRGEHHRRDVTRPRLRPSGTILNVASGGSAG